MTSKTVPLSRLLRDLGACYDAVDWAGERDLATAWRDCPRADWMLWMLARSEGWSIDALNAASFDIMADALESARTVAGTADYWPQVEDAHRLVREAIAGRGDLSAARSAAESAAWSAADSAARSAARSAAWSAAWSAARSAAASAAWSAARSAASAARSAASAARSAARSAVRSAEIAAWSRLADILRQHFPSPPCPRSPAR